MTQRQRDLEILDRALSHLREAGAETGSDYSDQDDPELRQFAAFTEMRVALVTLVPRRCGFANPHYQQDELTAKQRSWVKGVLEKYEPAYENLVSSGKVRRGREVATIEALRPENLPKRPPGRR